MRGVLTVVCVCCFFLFSPPPAFLFFSPFSFFSFFDEVKIQTLSPSFTSNPSSSPSTKPPPPFHASLLASQATTLLVFEHSTKHTFSPPLSVANCTANLFFLFVCLFVFVIGFRSFISLSSLHSLHKPDQRLVTDHPAHSNDEPSPAPRSLCRSTRRCGKVPLLVKIQ